MGSPAELPPGVIRVRLHSVASGGTKFVLGGCLVVATVLLPPVLGLVAGVLADAARPGAGWLAGALVGAACAVPLVECLCWLFRSAAWLEDTTLIVHGTLGTRRCDLAAATRLDLETVTELPVGPVAGGMAMMPAGRRVLRLVAYDGATGRRVALRLVEPATGRPLAPGKLQAVCEAILAGRAPEPDGSPAWRVAAALRAMTTGHARPPASGPPTSGPLTSGRPRTSGRPPSRRRAVSVGAGVPRQRGR